LVVGEDAMNFPTGSVYDSRVGGHPSFRAQFSMSVSHSDPTHSATLAPIHAHDFELSPEIDPAVFGRRPLHRRRAEAPLRPLSPML
jgi:hypothetical protein